MDNLTANEVYLIYRLLVWLSEKMPEKLYKNSTYQCLLHKFSAEVYKNMQKMNVSENGGGLWFESKDKEK